MERVRVKTRSGEFDLKGPNALSLVMDNYWVGFDYLEFHYYFPRGEVKSIKREGFPLVSGPVTSPSLVGGTPKEPKVVESQGRSVEEAFNQIATEIPPSIFTTATPEEKGKKSFFSSLTKKKEKKERTPKVEKKEDSIF